MVENEKAALSSLQAVLAAIERLMVGAKTRGDGAEMARLRAFGLSVSALSAAHAVRIAFWESVEVPAQETPAAKTPSGPTPSPDAPPDLSGRISDASSMADLATVVDDAELACARRLAAATGELAGEQLRERLARAVAGIADGVALTRAAIEQNPSPWPGIPPS